MATWVTCNICAISFVYEGYVPNFEKIKHIITIIRRQSHHTSLPKTANTHQPKSKTAKLIWKLKIYFIWHFLQKTNKITGCKIVKKQHWYNKGLENISKKLRKYFESIMPEYSEKESKRESCISIKLSIWISEHG